MLQPDSQLANPMDPYPPQQPHTEYQPTLSPHPILQLPHVGYQSILAPYSLPQLSHSSHQPTFAQYPPPQWPHGRYQPIPAQYPLVQQPHGGYQQLLTQYPLPQQPYGTPSELLQQGITQLNVFECRVISTTGIKPFGLLVNCIWSSVYKSHAVFLLLFFCHTILKRLHEV